MLIFVMGEGAADVVIPAAPFLRELHEFGDDDIVASFSVPGGTHAVIDLFPSVQAQDDIGHFPVAEFRDLVVQENTVGGQREPELLIMFLFLRSSVFYQLLHHFPVHGGLSSEEVHLQVGPGSGIRDQEIQRFFSDFETHQGSAPVILSFFSEAVAARQVAVVGNMQAERLDHGLPGLEISHEFPVCILCKQLPGVDQLLHVLQDLFDLLLSGFSGKLFTHRFLYIFLQRFRLFQFADQRLRRRHRFIENRIRHMDRTGVDVHDNGDPIIDKLMDQTITPLRTVSFPKKT